MLGLCCLQCVVESFGLSFFSLNLPSYLFQAYLLFLPFVQPLPLIAPQLHNNIIYLLIQFTCMNDQCSRPLSVRRLHLQFRVRSQSQTLLFILVCFIGCIRECFLVIKRKRHNFHPRSKSSLNSLPSCDAQAPEYTLRGFCLSPLHLTPVNPFPQSRGQSGLFHPTGHFSQKQVF